MYLGAPLSRQKSKVGICQLVWSANYAFRKQGPYLGISWAHIFVNYSFRPLVGRGGRNSSEIIAGLERGPQISNQERYDSPYFQSDIRRL